MCTYGHLHTHTERGSVLDGMAQVEELIDTAKGLGQEFIAITDHGSMSSLWRAQEHGDKVGIKVIHGCEFYWEYSKEAVSAGAKGNGHLLILAKDNVGLQNMFRMHKWASKENFFRNPRITWEVLKEHAEGLIVTSACLGSEFNQFIMAGEVGQARDWARKFKEVFGEDFYIELQPNSIPEQHLCNEASIRIAEELGIQLVATNDVHYTFENDCFPHEVLLAMQFKKKMDDPKRFKFPADDFWLKSEEEMYATFEGLPDEKVQEAMHTTRAIADKCHTRIEKGHYLPHFHTIPEGETERTLLAKEIMVGLKDRGLERKNDFVKAVQHELDVIDRNGYSGYFLIVQDYVTSAKRRGELVGEGRGSGAGSKTAFTTGITDIPPHEFDLLFERFMADGREPDFDTDFSDQQAVFRDLQGKYGVPNVSRIIAFGKMTPKAVSRKVMNTFGHPFHVQNEISKLIPDGCSDLFQAIKEDPELQKMQQKYKMEFDVMARLQNVTSHLSQHAGGILIYPNLGDTLPLSWDSKNEIHVAGFDKYMLEELGHFKFDVLGLETLPVLHGALQSINESINPELKTLRDSPIDLVSIDYEDQDVYDMLCEGDVSGVFQLAAQSTKVMEQQPRSFRDLIAINALIRPGVGDWEEYLARRKGKEYNIYEPRRPYMEETRGTMTYQEQFLLDAHVLAGWDIAFADKRIRKNKDIRNDAELREKFVSDGVANGHSEETLRAVWAEVEDAVDGGYSFNKSHSASYARLSYQTAYLKKHYPAHFYASLMSGEKTDGDGQDAIAKYIAECKQKGIEILPPDINDSDDNFVVNDRGIAYRITTIKHVGDSAIEHIKQLRPIASFDDFMERREKKFIKKNVMVNLIKAGVFDFDEPNRGELMWRFDMSERTKTQIKEGYECPHYDWSDKVKCEWEKEVLGMYLSIHPMERFSFQPLSNYQEGAQALQGGEVVRVFDFHPKKDPSRPKMAFVDINTLYGHVKLVVFASNWARKDFQEGLQLGNLVLVKGKRQGNDVLVDEVEVL
jgi:DNA polymerase III subunit alpha